MMRAILSVYDKTGVVEFGRALREAGFEVVSTGGTRSALEAGGIDVTSISDVTGFPEIMEGRVKTLHPAVHGGILARRDRAGDMEQLIEHGINAVDLVAVNLYPFTKTISRPGVQLPEALENIDIGGPAMVRAAAKNFPNVLVVVDPSDYRWIAGQAPASVTLPQRRALAAKAFAHVSAYDAAIAGYLGPGDGEDDGLPDSLTISAGRTVSLRYGENPHQAGALYSLGGGGVAGAEQLSGRDLSFNNLLDADAAHRVVSEFADGTAVIIKHNNPCGLASDPDQALAYRKAFEGDPVSAYGGIVGFNRAVTAATARAMDKVFFEVVVAPDYGEEALRILSGKRNRRILKVGPDRGPRGPELRRITGGLLAQDPDDRVDDAALWEVVTERRPTPGQMADLAFAWVAAKHVRSNAIVLARDLAMTGMGAGQPNRLSSIHLAVRGAGDRAGGSVLASDAFFPFADNVEMAAEAGISAVVQPGGSIRDKDVIAAANALGVAMLFTGRRHFRH